MRKKLPRLTSALTVFLTLIVVNGCTATPPTECAWVKKITLAPQDKVARTTENKIIAHNMKVERFCR